MKVSIVINKELIELDAVHMASQTNWLTMLEVLPDVADDIIKKLVEYNIEAEIAGYSYLPLVESEQIEVAHVAFHLPDDSSIFYIDKNTCTR